MADATTLDRGDMAKKLEMGKRDDFQRVEYVNASKMRAGFYRNGGTHSLCIGDTMISQLEGHPFQGGLDRIDLRVHDFEGIRPFRLSGTSVPCAFHENGVRWTRIEQGFEAFIELMLHPELPILYRVCHVRNTGTRALSVDWMAGQDIGLAAPGALKNNEAYVCQYLDHQIAVHPVAGKAVFSRNNLDPKHPFAASFCLQGANSASTDGYQYFGTGCKVGGQPAALRQPSLEDRVRQYEFAYVALQSRRIELQPCQSSVTTFAMYVEQEHAGISSSTDLALLDGVLKADLPELGEKTCEADAPAYIEDTHLLTVLPLAEDELRSFFGGEWRHVERGEDGRLHSFFCGENTHVVLPEKEAAIERQHGTILKSAHGAELDENVLSVTCYGCGAFGSQFTVGNTSFGRFTTIQRNALNLERSSGIRCFAGNSGKWEQLGFPSVFAMELDRVRWIYKTGSSTFEVAAHATSETIEYAVIPLAGSLPEIRMVLEVCGDANEFDSSPVVEWDADAGLLAFRHADGTPLKSRFPEACLLGRIDAAACRVGGADVLGGRREPYVVIDFPRGKGSLSLTGHYSGLNAAVARFEKADEPDWNSLMANFHLESKCDVTSKLSDTLKWYAHNAMIHFAAPRGLEQYSGGAWGTRDVCQGPLEFLLALGHDRVAEDALLKTFSHQFPDTGNWPQWFMIGGFDDIQQKESHGDIVFWPIKAVCDYIEAAGDVRILDKEVPFFGGEETGTVFEHISRAVDHIVEHCVEGTALPSYGDGDWNDSLQPVNRQMKTYMVSGWTVGLAYQTLSALSRVYRAAGHTGHAEKLDEFLGRMFSDFQEYMIEGGIVAGFVLFGDGETTHMLHPSEEDGIKFRLLPINRSIISELFTPAEKDLHLDIAVCHLKFPDGMRLMDHPPAYTGGQSTRFQRAESASHFGREIGLQYVHAHIRYCEALAKVGRAEELVDCLLQVSPVAIRESVPNARPRQANLYFSSSDADVYDRYEAQRGMEALKQGRIGALGGWRLYSSGPGIYIGLVIGRLFGIRRAFGQIEIDPVLPKKLNGSVLDLDLYGRRIQWIYRVERHTFAPARVLVNGVELTEFRLLENPYRTGGYSIAKEHFLSKLTEEENTVEIHL
jgi:CRISPR-associated protein Csx3